MFERLVTGCVLTELTLSFAGRWAAGYPERERERSRRTVMKSGVLELHAPWLDSIKGKPRTKKEQKMRPSKEEKRKGHLHLLSTCCVYSELNEEGTQLMGCVWAVHTRRPAGLIERNENCQKRTKETLHEAERREGWGGTTAGSA
jgi:hypothetical protein